MHIDLCTIDLQVYFLKIYVYYSEFSNKRGVLITCRQEKFPKSNKRGGSNKACMWETFIIKNKIFCTLIKEFRVYVMVTEFESNKGVA